MPVCIYMIMMLTCSGLQFLPIMISRISLSAPGPGGAVLYVEPHVSVRDTIAWAIGKVVLNQINQLDDATLNTIVDVICGCLKDEPRVVVNACYVSAHTLLS